MPHEKAPSERGLTPVFRVDFADNGRLGRGKIELLEHIRDTGSISAAGRAMDMSYRRAWQLVDALNTMFEQPSVSSQRGGKQGGGAILTPFGEELIRRFRHMEMTITKALYDDFIWLEEHQKR